MARVDPQALTADATLSGTQRTGDSGEPEPALLAEGEELGRYVIRRKLGAGGMSVVYVAHDPELDRDVALKVLRAPGKRSSRSDGSTRMLREAQAQARLSHPNVVAIYDVGLYQGDVFIAMELVAGETLSQWSSASPRTWSEVLRVLAAAGAGLAAAHRVNLVHRDFKPDNVLVGTDGRVRVLDFGLARGMAGERSGPDSEGVATARASSGGIRESGLVDTDLTRAGVRVGTPAYMSPEQHLGESPTAASDQFSFCVTLFECLHGHRPFVGNSMKELYRAAVRRQVEGPLSATVPGWLQQIVVRGLDPDPGARFASMDGLMRGLRPRRQRLGVALAGAAGVVGVVGVSYAALSAETRCEGAAERIGTVWNEHHRGTAQAAFVATEVPDAGVAWDRVDGELEAFVQRWALAAREACEASEAGRLEAGAFDRRMVCLRHRIDELASVADLLASADRAVVARAGALTAGLGMISACSDDAVLGDAFSLPEDPANRDRVTRAQRLMIEHDALARAGRDESSKARALEASEIALGVDHAVAAEALLGLAKAHSALREFARADEVFQQAYWAASERGHDRVAGQAAGYLVRAAGVHMRRKDEGLSWARHARTAIKRLGGDPLLEAIVHDQLGQLHMHWGEPDAAEPELMAGLRIAEQAGLWSSVASILANLGSMERERGNTERAVVYQQRALVSYERELGAHHPAAASVLHALAITHASRGRFERARPLAERALAIREAELGPGHVGVLPMVSTLGNIAHATGDYPRALEHQQRAVALGEREFGPDHVQVSGLYHGLAIALEGVGRSDEALGYYERGLTLDRKALGDDHPDVAISLFGIAQLLGTKGEHERAVGLLTEAIDVFERSFGGEHPHVGAGLTELGLAELALGHKDNAQERAERAIAILSQGDPNPRLLGRAQFLMAQALWPERRAKARAFARQALASYGQEDAGAPQRVAEVRSWLGRVGSN